jgi:Putative helicase/Putative conjugal transfer nickase/helicase TraI C-term
MIKNLFGNVFGERPAADDLPPVAASLPPEAFPVLPARDLLSRRRDLVNRIGDLADTTRPDFERYYLAALRRFAAWAQEFPLSAASPQPGGLLDHGLESAAAALRIRQGRLPPGAASELWTYAVFTLALLRCARSAPGLAAVTVSGGDGGAEWAWNPWGGAIGDNPKARRYRVASRPGGDGDAVWRRGAGVLLVPYLLDAEALAWLLSDAPLYGMWFACACGETARAGVLAEIANQAEAEAFGLPIPPPANAAELRPVPVGRVESAAPPVAPVQPAVLAVQPERPRRAKAVAENAAPTPGRECLDWIVAGVASGRIPCNQPWARVHGVPEGVLLVAPGILQDYAKSTGSADFEAVQRSFLKLGLHEKTPEGLNFHRYALSGHNAFVNGLLLADPQAVFGSSAPGLNPLLERL